MNSRNLSCAKIRQFTVYWNVTSKPPQKELTCKTCIFTFYCTYLLRISSRFTVKTTRIQMFQTFQMSHFHFNYSKCFKIFKCFKILENIVLFGVAVTLPLLHMWCCRPHSSSLLQSCIRPDLYSALRQYFYIDTKPTGSGPVWKCCCNVEYKSGLTCHV